MMQRGQLLLGVTLYAFAMAQALNLQSTPASATRPFTIPGVAGIDNELEAIRRFLFVPLNAESEVLGSLGLSPSRGLFLHGEPSPPAGINLHSMRRVDRHRASLFVFVCSTIRHSFCHIFVGPSGCGKSFVAKSLARCLSPRPATVLSGTRALSLSLSVEAGYAIWGDALPVPCDVIENERSGGGEAAAVALEAEAPHVVILEDVDIVGRLFQEHHNSVSSGPGVRGDCGDAATHSGSFALCESLDLACGPSAASKTYPVIVMCLTARPDLVDPSVRRRLDCSVALPAVPKVSSRAEILKLHCGPLRSSGRLNLGDDQTWIDGFAARASLSAAGIAGLVRSASLQALARGHDFGDSSGSLVTRLDFEDALAQVQATSPAKISSGAPAPLSPAPLSAAPSSVVSRPNLPAAIDPIAATVPTEAAVIADDPKVAAVTEALNDVKAKMAATGWRHWNEASVSLKHCERANSVIRLGRISLSSFRCATPDYFLSCVSL